MSVPPIASWFLWPLSVLYGAVVRLRAWFYARGVLTQRRLKTPVISVGNLTVGGTGKTPMVIWLAERFLSQGKRVGILTRGYKGRGNTSDEIELMRSRLGGGVLFGVGKNRYEQGRQLEGQGVDIFLLDDGYQHLQLARDVNILLLDGSRKLKREWLLPAGTLREPISAMQRASLLVITRSETLPGADAAIERLENYPVFSASTCLLGFRQWRGGVQVLCSSEIGAGPFFAFCGIGNPGAFLTDLRNWNIPLVGAKAFPDHHPYTAREAKELETAARAAGARALITTEKDAQNFAASLLLAVPLYVAVIESSFSREDLFLATIREQLATRHMGA